MKPVPTMDDASLSFDNAITILRKHFTHTNYHNPDSIKLSIEYYKWITLKTSLIINEKRFQIPASALPSTIQKSIFDWLHAEKQAIVSRYYKFDNLTNKYVIAVKKDTVLNEHIELLMRSIILVRKAVVWVDFGYNIGTEFGGRHPAIILKNLKNSLIVIPLSSKSPKSMDYNVKVEKVYGFPTMNRWVNVTRITPVSLSRVHFQKIGDVKPSVLTEISNKMAQCGIV